MQAVRSLLILLPLPIVAAWIAYSGFNYEPQDLKLSLDARPASLIRLPETVAGFKMSGTPRSYNRENLYEYVNGHAEFFLSSGFVSLTVADYAPKSGGQIVAEMYDMEDGRNAKGTLMSEKGDSRFVESIGSAAFSQKGSFLFSKGRYYVRLGLFNADDESAKKLAVALAEMIKGEVAVEATILPLSGKKENSESFTKSDYMGLSFLADVSTAQYSFGKAEFEGFSWSGGAQELIKFFTNESAEIKSSGENGIDNFIIRDKYEGTIHLVSDGRNSIGLRGDFGSVDPEAIKKFMQRASENLRR